MRVVSAELGWMRARWDAFWFAPAASLDLGVCRFLFYGHLLWLSLSIDSAGWALVGPAFWMPTEAFALLGLGPAPKVILHAIDIAWRVALLASCLGLFTRPATALAFVLGFYVLGLPQCFGKTDHWSGLIVVVLAILALSRCGEGFSLDELRRRREPRADRLDGEYRWPIRMVWLAMTLVFFAAGVAKLRHTGLAWMSPENFRAILLVHHYQIDRELPALGLHVAELPWLCMMLAIATVVIQIGAPLALVSRRARLALIPGLLAFQIGSAVLLGVHASLPFLGLYAFWIPWSVLASMASAKPSVRGERSPRATTLPFLALFGLAELLVA